MAGQFGDYESATKMRDIIRDMVRKEIAALRPEVRVGQVKTINRDDLTAEVSFAGDAGSINARFGKGLIPRDETAIVRVGGTPGNYYITEILNQPPENEAYEPVKTAFDAGELGGGDPGPTEPPATSPAIEVYGTAETFILKAAPVEDSSQIIYQVSTDYDPNTQVGTWQSLSNMPTRSNIYATPVDANDVAFSFDQTYWFRAVATNVEGDSPNPSPPVSGMLDPEKVSDLVLNRVVSGIVMAGRFESGNGYWDPDEGLVLPQPNGLVTRLSTDGVTPSVLSGEFIAQFLTVNNGTMNGLIDVFGTMKMVEGVTAPRSAPTVPTVASYEGYNLPNGVYTDQRGICKNLESTGSRVGGFATARTLAKQIVIYPSFQNQTTFSNTVKSLTGTNEANYTRMTGITTDGTNYYVIVKNTAGTQHWVLRVDPSGAITGEWNLAEVVPNSWDPTIGYDHTSGRIVVAQITSGTANIVVRWYTKDSNTMVGSCTCTGPSTNHSPNGVDMGNADFGANRIVLWFPDYDPRVYTTTGTRDTPIEWPKASTTIAGGFWDATSGYFYSTTQYIVYRYEPVPFTGATQLLYGGYTWASEDGTVETTISPLSTWTRVRRSGFFVIAKSQPPEYDKVGAKKANRVAFYISTTNTNMIRHSIGPVGETYFRMGSYIPTGTNPPASNQFVAYASPGVFESAGLAGGVPIVRVGGDGAWRLGAPGGLSGDTSGNAFGMVPIGVPIPYPGTTAPAGYLMVTNGASFSEATYPLLAAVVLSGGFATATGTAPNRTVTIPSFSGRVIRGGTPSNAATGSNTSALTESNLPAHDHSMAHTHTAGSYAISGGAHEHVVNRRSTTGTNVGVAQGGGTNATDATTSGGDSHSHTMSGSSGPSSAANTGNGSGTGASFSVLNSGLTMNVIMRAQ